MLERTGEVYPIGELPAAIVAEPASMIVAENMGEYVLRLSEAFADSETFQYKLTPIYRDLHPTNGEVKRRAVLRDTTTSLIGFPGRFHHPVDPNSFIRFGIDEIIEGDAPRLAKLMQWGREVRDFCLANDMKVKPSAGGLAAQLLRDPRFYPHARRKVPKMINARGREKLPGNFYELRGETHKPYAASYLDMQGAHHHIAQTVEFPCANSLHAYGYFTSGDPRIWAKAGSARFDQTLQCYGLLHIQLSVPHLPPATFAPPYMQLGHGLQDAWVFTNELPLVRELGGKVEAIYCALVSPDRDAGLAKYAKYAEEQLAEKPDAKPWLKPVLHSAYGVLAGRPRPVEIGWRNAKGGADGEYPMWNKMVPVRVVKTKHEIEAVVVNAIHRGMIEAEQRSMSLLLARNLTAQGGRVLCVYADSLFVDMEQLPLLPVPWRLKEQVTDLQFLSATHFVSPQMTRLPGIPAHMQKNFSPATRTRALDGSGLPARADSGTRVFRPMGRVDLSDSQLTKPERARREAKTWHLRRRYRSS
jgi:hypothetical protein